MASVILLVVVVCSWPFSRGQSEHAEQSLMPGGYSMGGRSLGVRQDCIIGRFHHGGALAVLTA